MKQVLKLIGGLLAGGAFGFAIAVCGVVLFTDMTFAEYFEKFAKIEILEIVGILMFSILAFVVSLFLHIILHEGGHFVCGLLSGYKFVSFRIFNWVIIRLNGKLQVKKFGIAGTGGQCLLTPPQLPLEQIPTVMYNAGGVLFNLIFVVASIFVLACTDAALVKSGTVIFALTGAFLALMNGVPMKVGGVNNDAYNILTMNKNLETKRGFEVQLRANAMIQEGYTPKEMPAEWFEIQGELDYKNPIQLTTYIQKASLYMDLGEMERAYSLLKEVYAHKEEIMELLRKEVECELIFVASVMGDADFACEILTPPLQKYIDQYAKVMSSKMRTQWAIEKYINLNPDKAEQIYSDLIAKKDQFLMQGEAKMDITLIASYIN